MDEKKEGTIALSLQVIEKGIVFKGNQPDFNFTILLHHLV